MRLVIIIRESRVVPKRELTCNLTDSNNVQKLPADSGIDQSEGQLCLKTLIYCCISNYLISDLKDHLTAKIPDSTSGHFTSGSAGSLTRQLVD